MTTIHDNEAGSRMRELERSLSSTRVERDALACRMDELESVLAAGRLGYCRIALGSRELRANSQFKTEFPVKMRGSCGQTERPRAPLL